MNTHSNDAEWLDWIEVQKKATEAWIDGDLKAEISLVDRYLEGVVARDLQRQAIEKALRQSWRLLQIEGEPNLYDLEATTRKLLAEQSRR